ncbi:MAG: HlyC/CorC family transporter [Chloroflexota bacterium]|nr:hemolysin family protein [Chloroflexota bacterium]MDE3101158.1 HlyC/CorC family transporter [Chloroflexota bacterium]
MDVGAALPALLLSLLILLVNAFFVAAELALVRVRETQLRELAERGSARARLAEQLSANIDRYLSATQLGVTAASLALGLVGEPAIAALIRPLFGWLIERSDAAFGVVSFVISFGVVTYVTVVAGELAPKYLAIQRALDVALLVSYPLELFYRVAYPLIWLMNVSANGLVALLGVRRNADLDAHSEEELKMLVAISTRKGVLQESERVLLGRALDFADTFVRQIMVPRTEVVAIEDDRTLRDLRDLSREHPFTRFPVFHGDLDHIVGVVHLRDLVGAQDLSRTVREVMRRPLFLPETTRLDRALAEFRRGRLQLGIVIDEFGGTSGLATLEDVLEQLVGEVQDEFDRETPHFRGEPGGGFLVDGLASLPELRERLGVELEDEPYDTVGGMVFGRLGRLGKVGDTVDVEGYRFEVTAVDGRRVAQVRVAKVPAGPRAR